MTYEGKGGKQHTASTLADKIGMGINQRISGSRKSDSKYEKYTEKTKGQYVLEKKDRALSRRAIIRINEDGSQTEFESIYAAAMALGLHKNSVGNISKACDNGLVSYKHKWKWPEHTIAYVLGPSFGSTGEATPSTK
jgi:hypothetical protein